MGGAGRSGCVYLFVKLNDYLLQNKTICYTSSMYEYGTGRALGDG